MVTKIQKWGNSLGLRIPKAFAEQAGVAEGSSVDLSIEGDSLVIRPIQNNQYELNDLVSEIREDNIHGEISSGDPTGRESW